MRAASVREVTSKGKEAQCSFNRGNFPNWLSRVTELQAAKSSESLRQGRQGSDFAASAGDHFEEPPRSGRQCDRPIIDSSA